LVLSNGFSVGCIISVLLHLALPFDAVDNVDADSASVIATHVNPSAEGDLAHQKVSTHVYGTVCQAASSLLDSQVFNTTVELVTKVFLMW